MSGKQHSLVAIIPARGGSKGVPGKNIRTLADYPLIAYTIAAALECPAIDRILVSTDSEEISEMARKFGAEVPFLRPVALATDKSPDIDYMRHAMEWLSQHGKSPEYLMQLRPTTPLREPHILLEAFQRIQNDNTATGLRSAHLLPEPPQKMIGIENGFLTGLFPHDPRPEYYNLPRQSFPPAYHPNGYVDIVRSRTLESAAGLYGSRVLVQVTPIVKEIDTEEDWSEIEWQLEKKSHVIQTFFDRRYGTIKQKITRETAL